MVDRNDPDVALMLRVKEGDLSAYETLVEKFKQPVMNLVYRLINDIDEAEDIAQNVFVQVWKTRERYEPASKFTTWLFTIARNLGLNEIRRRTRHPADSLDEPRPDSESQPLRVVEDASSSIPTAAALSGELRLDLLDNHRGPGGYEIDARRGFVLTHRSHREGLDVVATAGEQPDHTREHARFVVHQNREDMPFLGLVSIRHHASLSMNACVILAVVASLRDERQVGRVRAVVGVPRALLVGVRRGELVGELAGAVEHLAGVVGAVRDLREVI